eukprot:CAMPEP_0194508222 /NCGR_PEP_ID=MMETSP0253-20130528/38199_1 /TAXON_ID=2966 /ORGANISM="Noctiluca scintillans" /LENGTH=38 /DNA_ID= /DNA_START= /DNA_END= /DNA_ORIENTATION=
MTALPQCVLTDASFASSRVVLGGEGICLTGTDVRVDDP